jgi:hypothetical protein
LTKTIVGLHEKWHHLNRNEWHHQTEIRNIFSQNTTLSYGNLVCELKERLGIKDRQAKNYVKMMRDQDIIQQNEMNSGDYSVVNGVNSDLFSGD